MSVPLMLKLLKQVRELRQHEYWTRSQLEAFKLRHSDSCGRMHIPILRSITHLEIVGHQQSGKETIYRWRFTLPFGIQYQFDEIVTNWIEPERFSYSAITGWKMEATNLPSRKTAGRAFNLPCASRCRDFCDGFSQNGYCDWGFSGLFEI